MPKSPQVKEALEILEEYVRAWTSIPPDLYIMTYNIIVKDVDRAKFTGSQLFGSSFLLAYREWNYREAPRYVELARPLGIQPTFLQTQWLAKSPIIKKFKKKFLKYKEDLLRGVMLFDIADFLPAIGAILDDIKDSRTKFRVKMEWYQIKSNIAKLVDSAEFWSKINVVLTNRKLPAMTVMECNLITAKFYSKANFSYSYKNSIIKNSHLKEWLGWYKIGDHHFAPNNSMEEEDIVLAEGTAILDWEKLILPNLRIVLFASTHPNLISLLNLAKETPVVKVVLIIGEKQLPSYVSLLADIIYQLYPTVQCVSELPSKSISVRPPLLTQQNEKEIYSRIIAFQKKGLTLLAASREFRLSLLELDSLFHLHDAGFPDEISPNLPYSREQLNEMISLKRSGLPNHNIGARLKMADNSVGNALFKYMPDYELYHSPPLVREIYSYFFAHFHHITAIKKAGVSLETISKKFKIRVDWLHYLIKLYWPEFSSEKYPADPAVMIAEDYDILLPYLRAGRSISELSAKYGYSRSKLKLFRGTTSEKLEQFTIHSGAKSEPIMMLRFNPKIEPDIWNIIKQFNQQPEQNNANKKKLTAISQMQILAANRKGKCLSKMYLSGSSPLRWQCENGHVWESIPRNVARGHWCPICGKSKKRK